MTHPRAIILIAILAAIVAANVYDLWIDYGQGATDWHLFEEAIVVILSAGAIAWLVTNLFRQRDQLRRLRDDLAASHQSKESTNERLADTRQRMGEVIQEQFTAWNLTPSEREVALLLLKGLSFKEIAAVRETLEKTVRQQASSIYKKADVAGRASFSAWFIEDIL